MPIRVEGLNVINVRPVLKFCVAIWIDASQIEPNGPLPLVDKEPVLGSMAKASSCPAQSLVRKIA